MSLSPVVRRYWLLVLFFLLTAPAFPQNTRLPYRPIRAEWSSALNRIVMVSSAPNQLHLFDPATQTTQSVALNAVPVALSLSPDGLFAAVGHLTSASYIDLRARTVLRTYDYATLNAANQTFEVVLAAEWIYVFLPSSTTNALSIRLSTGVNTPLSSLNYFGSGVRARLHPSGSLIHLTRDGSGTLQRYPLGSAGTLGAPIDAPSQNFTSCGPVWHSPDGTRIYTGCGTALRYNPDPAQDMRPIGRFLNAQVRAFTESSDGRIAFIPSATSTPGSPLAATDLDNKVILLSRDGFSEQGRLSIPTFTVGTRTFLGQGRFALFNSSGSAIHVVYQAESSSGLLNDFAIQTYELANPAPCPATFASTSLTVPSEGFLQSLEVQAPADCVYRIVSSADWLQPIMEGPSSGLSRVALHVRANLSQQARNGTVTLGAQALQIAQTAAPAAAPVPRAFSYPIRDAAYSKSLDRIVLATAGVNELHLFDPVTGDDPFLRLSQPALSLSVSPDGRRAAVGHLSSISIINLQTRTVEKVIQTSIDGATVLLTGGNWLYVFSANSGAQVIQISTEIARPFSGSNFVSAARLHASNNFAYLNTSSLGWTRLDTRDGATLIASSGLSTNTCGNLWTSEDGRRFYTACGGVFRSSESLAEDGLPNGNLSGIANFSNPVAWPAHLASRQQIAVLTATTGSSSDPLSPDVHLFADDGLLPLGRIRLAPRPPSGATISTRGRWLFASQDATRLFAITQLNTSNSSSPGTPVPPNEFFVETVSVDNLASCAVTVSPSTVQASGSPESVMLNVQTGPGCIWTANITSNSFWIRFPGGSSLASGAGPGPLTLSLAWNSDSTSRSATIDVAGNPVTVTQTPAPPLTISPTVFEVSAEGGFHSVQVLATNNTLPWSTQSNVSWISIISPPSGSGNSTVTFNVNANSGPARTGTLAIAGRIVTVNQVGNSLPNGMRFVPITPCRIVDTRGATGETGPFGAPVMDPATQRDFPIPTGRCFLPTSATAYSLNATVVPRGPLSYLTLWPTGQPRPLVSTLNSYDGRIKANAAIVPAGTSGSISAYVTDRTDVILDINGYFVPAATNPTAAPFYPVTPCRIADTRSTTMIPAGQSRTFNIGGACSGSIPSNATAFSLNITAIPRSGGLSYLTVWPTGAPQPTVSILNAPTGTVVANAALVPSGTAGSITIYATDNTDVVIDANGFFGGTTSIAPLNFHPLTPCRVYDSRDNSVGLGRLLNGGPTYTYNPRSTCGISPQAAAYSLNATVVPVATLQYLSIWPAGVIRPLVSTLNAFDGAVTSNALLIPAGSSGSIDAFASNATHLILDVNGFFAP